jgi:hypothetical protein
LWTAVRPLLPEGFSQRGRTLLGDPSADVLINVGGECWVRVTQDGGGNGGVHTTLQKRCGDRVANVVQSGSGCFGYRVSDMRITDAAR